MRLATFAITFATASCGSQRQTTMMSTSDPSEYPCVLRDPRMLHPDFMVRQTLAIHARAHGSNPIDAELDAVVQKADDTLVIVGFGPMNVKAFTLTQKGDRIEFVQFMGPALPFSPRNVLIDVHRVYFKRLAVPLGETAATYSGVRRGELDGETVEETWQGGELRSTVYTRPANMALRGGIRIALGPGCTYSACEPETVSLDNEWFGYQLAITNHGYERL